MMKPIAFDPTQPDAFGEWKRLLALYLAKSHTFEIHCWQDELDAMETALRFGAVQPSDWMGGVVVAGEVTQAFRDLLLSLPRPADREVYPKVTPFFNIMLDGGFCAEHYGTELFEKTS